MFNEDELVPLSALQHLVFCERQCALIHVERVWRDNPLTIEGSHSHQRVHEEGPRRELRGDTLIVRGLPLRSLRLGLVGRADVVEFRKAGRMPNPGSERSSRCTLAVDGLDGFWIPYPVEYKRGRPKPDHSDEVQLCAQAICLEEMLDVTLKNGALFYGARRRRHDVTFSSKLRMMTEHTAARLHEIMSAYITPTALRAPKCRRCSLLDLCRPQVTGTSRMVSRYVKRACAEITRDQEVDG